MSLARELAVLRAVRDGRRPQFSTDCATRIRKEMAKQGWMRKEGRSYRLTLMGSLILTAIGD